MCYDADLKVFSFVWDNSLRCQEDLFLLLLYWEERQCIIGDAEGERIEEHYNTKLKLFIYLRKRNPTPLSKLCLVVWLINTAHTFYQLGTADKNLFALFFNLWKGNTNAYGRDKKNY